MVYKTIISKLPAKILNVLATNQARFKIGFVNFMIDKNVSREEKSGNIAEKIADKPNETKKLDLTFSDYRAAYSHKSTWEISRALFVYSLFSSKSIADNNLVIMKYMRKILGKTVFEWLMKMTFYGHFVAGEDEIKIQPVLDRLTASGVSPILDYSAEEDLAASQEVQECKELSCPLPQFQHDKSVVNRRSRPASARTYFYQNEASCEKNQEIFLRCLEAVVRYGDGITAIKITALGRPSLLLQVSDVIMRTRDMIHSMVGGSGNIISNHTSLEVIQKRLQDLSVKQESIDRFFKHATEDKEGLIHLFPWTGIINREERLSNSFVVPDQKTGQLVSLISKLSCEEEEQFQNMIRRVTVIMQAAEELGVSVMVDAEQTYFQPAISRLTLELMRKYNKNRPVVLNTYQCYLRDIMSELRADLEQSRRQDFYFGAKLVRGAYLEQERERALELDYPDPTNPTFEATSVMYNKALKACIKMMKDFKSCGGDPKRVTIMAASHNEETVREAITEMASNGITAKDKSLLFGQLYGMSDYLTFPLGQAGYKVYKYIPYGPIAEVLPYLSRRAQENKGILQKIKKEKKLLRKALLDRILLSKSNAKKERAQAT